MNTIISVIKDTVEPPVSDHSKINVKPIWSLTDVVSYESLDRLGTNFCLISIW